MEPTPKSLILDLLSTVGRQAAPVRALVAAAGLFAIAENSLRVALARLRAEGRIERDARGRYRLGPSAAAVSGQIRSWRRLEQRLLPWTGRWVGVHTAGLSRATPRQRRERARALRYLGFRPAAPGLDLRPDNLVGGVADVRERLGRLGLGPPALVFGLDELDAAEASRVCALWDAEALVRAYRATRARLEESGARLDELPREAAMAESFRLGGAAIRQLVLDPLLPEEIVPGAERRALERAIHAYDALGRRVWTGWLGADDPDPRHCPAGVRGPRPGADPWPAGEGA